jgi:DNA-binding response OmpR family regulator
MMTILLVKADDAQCHALHHFLQKARYWVDLAPTYASGVRQLAQRDYDFVLLAQELPDA